MFGFAQRDGHKGGLSSFYFFATESAISSVLPGLDRVFTEL